jgi:hypothetical protein
MNSTSSQRTARFFFVVFVAFLLMNVAGSAHANSGSPLLIATQTHLFIGNILIGIVEGFFISWAFGTRRKESILVMIVANFVSMILGVLAILPLSASFVSSLYGGYSIYNKAQVSCCLAVLSFPLTILIEWPFCFCILYGKVSARWRSFQACSLAQTLSYTLLIPFYLFFVLYPPWGKYEFDKTLRFAPSKGMWIYYLAEHDQELHRIRPNASEQEKVMDLDHPGPIHIGVVHNATSESWDLVGSFVSERIDQSYRNVLIEDLSIAEGTNWLEKDHWWEKAVIASSSSEWEVYSDYVLNGHKVNDYQEMFYVGMTYPFLPNPFASFVTQIPCNQVIFQVAEEIVIYDIDEKKLGVITRGQEPMVVLEKEYSDE